MTCPEYIRRNPRFSAALMVVSFVASVCLTLYAAPLVERYVPLKVHIEVLLHQ